MSRLTAKLTASIDFLQSLPHVEETVAMESRLTRFGGGIKPATVVADSYGESLRFDGKRYLHFRGT